MLNSPIGCSVWETPASLSPTHSHGDLGLRKHIVEKLRRDPISSSMEQLQPAMMVRFLIRHLQERSVRRSSFTVAVSEGYSSCIQEVKNLLSQDERQTEGQKNLLSHLQSAGFILPRAGSKKTSLNNNIWRPW
uniref:Orange domain-containing protein n=1 Tax=Paramormyrops kingsleyae TaxID=1676925 RepID=A0A3B3T1Z4_9TELE